MQLGCMVTANVDPLISDETEGFIERTRHAEEIPRVLEECWYLGDHVTTFNFILTHSIA